MAFGQEILFLFSAATAAILQRGLAQRHPAHSQ